MIVFIGVKHTCYSTAVADTRGGAREGDCSPMISAEAFILKNRRQGGLHFKKRKHNDNNEQST